MKVVTAAESIAAIRAKGLDQLGGMGEESTETYFLMKWGINRSAGIIKNAGKVIRLKIPKTTTKARIADANADDRCCKDCQLVFQQPQRLPTLFSTILWIKTRLQATASVSIEFEKVWVWYVQVTYDDATKSTATRRCRGDWTNSWSAQSSRTKLRTNINTRRVQNTAIGGISPSFPFPIHSHRRRSIGRP